MKSQLPRYIATFGFFKGVELYGKAKFCRQEHKVTVPGLPQPIRLRGGTSDRQVFQKIFLEGEYDVDLGFPLRTILDGGAHVGYSSLFFARRFPEALIIAVEPERDNFRLLTQNTAAYPNIRTVQKALWPKTTYLTIENTVGQPDAFRVREAEQGEQGAIPTITIEELLHAAGADELDLLKLDVEGSEKELFEDPGRDGWLTRTRALIMELHDRFKPGCTAAVERAMVRHKFRQARMGENVLFVRET